MLETTILKTKLFKALTQIQVCKLSAFPLSPIQCWKDFNHDQHCQLSNLNPYVLPPGLSLRAITHNPVMAELCGCYWVFQVTIAHVLSVYLQIVTGVHTQVMAN